MHLTGVAQLWYARLELTSGTPSWCHFAQLVQQRFGPPITDSPIGELMLLRRTGTVDDYTDQFLALACHDADLSEQRLVQIYTTGLVNPLKTDIALRRPASLDEAIMLARAYEQHLQLSATDQVHTKGGRTGQLPSYRNAPSKGAFASTATSSTASAPQGPAKAAALSPALPRRRLSSAEMAQRRADGLCYNCDEKFVVGHRCKRLFTIEVSDDDAEINEAIECAALNACDAPGISLHVVTGLRARGFHTMKVYVSIGDAVAVALLDSGSSHNFIDIDMARRAGVQLQARAGLSVAVANGDRLASPGKAPAQAIYIGGEPFVVDLYALPLGDYDMVLGVQWLGTLGPVLWDFASQTIAFEREGRRVLWRGVNTTTGPALAALSGGGEDLLDALLAEFASIFVEPQGLPPRRQLCHHIRLKPGTGAVAVRPYRYAHAQKDKLECQCDEMLRTGVIRPNSSEFSSPTLLIRKADGTWRFCVDYRALNDVTIKDQFSIPVVEELLDELWGAWFFTKLDLGRLSPGADV
jgi:hypothetical protein